MLSKSDVDLLHSIEEAQRLCEEHPEHIQDFLSLIIPLIDNEYPWVQKNANKCVKTLKKIDENYRRNNRKSKDKRAGNVKFTNVDDFVDQLLLILKQKRNYQQKVQDIYMKHNVNLPEIPPPIKEQLLFIIKKKVPNYLSELFSKREILRIAIMIGIDVIDISNNLDLISLEIYQALGFETSRGDFLEI